MLPKGKSSRHHTYDDHDQHHEQPQQQNLPANANDDAHQADLDACLAFDNSRPNSRHRHRRYLEGYLHKVADSKFRWQKHKRRWHRRWFVLDIELGRLSYYKNNPRDYHQYDDVCSMPSMEQPIKDQATELEQRRHQAGPSSVSSSSSAFTSASFSSSCRGSIDLRQEHVSLLFEKKFALYAPSPYFFQVSILGIGDATDLQPHKSRGCIYKVGYNRITKSPFHHHRHHFMIMIKFIHDDQENMHSF
jgi:hypothetical protein